jgi:hypothetical protein
LKPESNENCVMAETMFALCRTAGMAVAVSRCASFEKKA